MGKASPGGKSMSWLKAIFLVLLSKALGRIGVIEDWVAREIEKEFSP